MRIMRNYLIMLMVMLMPFVACGQKLNSRGEKMVDKVQVSFVKFTNGQKIKSDCYDFRYDDRNNIVGLDVKNDVTKEEHVISKSGNTLTRDFLYKGKPKDEGIRYEYMLDDAGHVIQKVRYSGVHDHLTTKVVWNFMYRYDDYSGDVLLDSVACQSLYRDSQKGIRDYVPVDDLSEEPITTKVFRKDDGLHYLRRDFNDEGCWDSQTTYNEGIGDDTNIDLNALIGDTPYCMVDDVTPQYEFIVSGWANAKSGNMLDIDGSTKYVIIVDKKGNISRIEGKDRNNGRLKVVYEIYYK